MPAVLWVATRKGLFRLESADGGARWRIANVAFLAEPVTMLLPDPRDGAVYAALKLGHFGCKTHRSDDNGTTWTEVATPAYPKSDDDKAPKLSQVWAMEAAGPAVADGIWAGTLPGGLFFSPDRGQTWSLNNPLWELPSRKDWMGGGYDEPGIHSICVDPRDRRHILIAVSTAGLWRSRDAGATWTHACKGMSADYMPPERREEPEAQDPHRLVQCPGNPDVLWVQHHCGIFRSTDCAETWQPVTGIQPSAFGFAVAVHPTRPDTAWFVPAVKDQTRVPVDARFVVARTRDGGKTCDVISKGLPADNCYDIVYRHCLEVDSTGSLLAMGSTTGHLWTSCDGGDSWRQLPDYLPPIYATRFGNAG